MSRGSVTHAISAYRNTVAKVDNIKKPTEAKPSKGLMGNKLPSQDNKRLEKANDRVTELVAEIRKLRQRNKDGRKG